MTLLSRRAFNFVSYLNFFGIIHYHAVFWSFIWCSILPWGAVGIVARQKFDLVQWNNIKRLLTLTNSNLSHEFRAHPWPSLHEHASCDNARKISVCEPHVIDFYGPCILRGPRSMSPQGQSHPRFLRVSFLSSFLRKGDEDMPTEILIRNQQSSGWQVNIQVLTMFYSSNGKCFFH